MNESLGFFKHLIADITGIFSLIILEIIYSSGFEIKQIPLGILDNIFYWKDFFEGRETENCTQNKDQ